MLREPNRQVSPRAVTLWRIQAAVTGVFLLAPPVLWWLLDRGPEPPWRAVATAVAVPAALAYLVWMPRVRYRIHRWETGSDAVYTQSGWLTIERRIAPFSRIQTVDTRRGPVARWLGLAAVTATTASAAGPIEIRWLDAPVAAELVEQLTRAAAAHRGDAT